MKIYKVFNKKTNRYIKSRNRDSWTQYPGIILSTCGTNRDNLEVYEFRLELTKRYDSKRTLISDDE